MKLFNHIRFYSLSFFLFSCFHLFSTPIDLSQDQSKLNLPITIDQDGHASFELHNLNKHTTYILHFNGDIHLINHSDFPITITDKNSILIENEGQISEKDVMSLSAVPVDGQLPASIELTRVTFKTDQYENLGNEHWEAYIDQGLDWVHPSEATKYLVSMDTDHQLKTVFALGCGSGRDPLNWTAHGSDVTVLDGTPHAVAITCLRLADRGVLSQLSGALACSLQVIPDDVGFFDVVTGSLVFPFLPPEDFRSVMSDKVLSHVAPSGYFAGDFFGPEHSWAENQDMTFLSSDELIDFFTQNGFEIVYFNDIHKMQQTAFNGIIPWHEIQIIAKKIN